MVVAAVCSFLLSSPSSRAHAICRVVESGDHAPVSFDPTTSAFYVHSPDAIIGWECPGGTAADAGSIDAGEPDAGSLEPDAGDPEPSDGGELDGGEPRDADSADAGDELDAGSTADAALRDAGPHDAGPFDGGARDPDGTPLCEGRIRATPVRASVISLVVQPHLLSGGGRSALIMPVPAHPQVVPVTPAIFGDVESASRNRVHERVEVTEDMSLGFQCTDPHYSAEAEGTDPGTMLAELAATVLLSPLGVLGCANPSSYYANDIGPLSTGTWSRDGGSGSVRYEEVPTTDDYEVTVLSATDGSVLSAWLDENGFSRSALDDQVFADYAGDDHWFVALEITPEAGVGARDLAPLVVSWLGTEIPVTHRLQYDPDGGVLVTDTWVLAPSRMDASDDSAITESADPLLIVPPSLSGFGLPTGWLTHLRVSRNQREGRPDATLRPTSNVAVAGTLERTTRVRIPLACCSDRNVAGPPRVHRHERTVPANEASTLPEAWLRSSYGAGDAVCGRAGSGGWGSPSGTWSSSSSGCGGTTSTSSGPSRSLRGCTVPRRAGAFWSWVPIAVAVLWLFGRSRRR